jgi:hypothetical protein
MLHRWILILILPILIGCSESYQEKEYVLSKQNKTGRVLIKSPFQFPPESSIQCGFITENDTLWFYYLNQEGYLQFYDVENNGKKEFNLTEFTNHSDSYLTFPLSFSYLDNVLYVSNQRLGKIFCYNTKKNSVEEFRFADDDGQFIAPVFFVDSPVFRQMDVVYIPIQEFVGDDFVESSVFAVATSKSQYLEGFPKEYTDNNYYFNSVSISPFGKGALINYQLSDSVDFLYENGKRERVYAGGNHPGFVSLPNEKINQNSVLQYTFKQSFYRRCYYMPEKNLIIRTLTKGSQKNDEETGSALPESKFSLLIGEKGTSKFQEIPFPFNEYSALKLHTKDGGIWLTKITTIADGEYQADFDFFTIH